VLQSQLNAIAPPCVSQSHSIMPYSHSRLATVQTASEAGAAAGHSAGFMLWFPPEPPEPPEPEVLPPLPAPPLPADELLPDEPPLPAPLLSSSSSSSPPQPALATSNSDNTAHLFMRVIIRTSRAPTIVGQRHPTLAARKP
jgi:hypothetical protein